MSKSELKRLHSLGGFAKWVALVNDILRADHESAPYQAHEIIEQLIYGGWTPPSEDAKGEDA